MQRTEFRGEVGKFVAPAAWFRTRRSSQAEPRPDATLSHGWLERELQLNIAARGAATLAFSHWRPRMAKLLWLLRKTYCRNSTTCAGWCRAARGPACSPTR